jgi:rhamnosyltransferase
MNRKIAIGFVTYNASTSLILRIQAIVSAGFKVYVFDNSPEDDLIRQNSKKLDRDFIKYTTCGKNLGLGYGISSVCAQAYYDSFKALIFFDQDTVFDLSTLEFIEKFYSERVNEFANYSAIVFNAKAPLGESQQVKDILLAISSGSLFLLDNLKKINWHNQNYFVDYVDYEFCLRSNNYKLKIGEYASTPGFDHESEQPDRIYKILGKERLLRKYSTSRVMDAVTASTKLFIQSIIAGNCVIAYAVFRSFVIYVNFQILIRIINIFKRQKQG